MNQNGIFLGIQFRVYVIIFGALIANCWGDSRKFEIFENGLIRSKGDNLTIQYDNMSLKYSINITDFLEEVSNYTEYIRNKSEFLQKNEKYKKRSDKLLTRLEQDLKKFKAMKKNCRVKRYTGKHSKNYENNDGLDENALNEAVGDTLNGGIRPKRGADSEQMNQIQNGVIENKDIGNKSHEHIGDILNILINFSVKNNETFQYFFKQMKNLENVTLELDAIIKSNEFFDAVEGVAGEIHENFANIMSILKDLDKYDITNFIPSERIENDLLKQEQKFKNLRELPIDITEHGLSDLLKIVKKTSCLQNGIINITMIIPTIQTNKCYIQYEVEPIPIIFDDILFIIDSVKKSLIFDENERKYYFTSETVNCKEIPFGDGFIKRMCNPDIEFVPANNICCEEAIMSRKSTVGVCEYIKFKSENYLRKIIGNEFYYATQDKMVISMECMSENESYEKYNQTVTGINITHFDSGCSIQSGDYHFKIPVSDESNQNMNIRFVPPYEDVPEQRKDIVAEPSETLVGYIGEGFTNALRGVQESWNKIVIEPFKKIDFDSLFSSGTTYSILILSVLCICAAGFGLYRFFSRVDEDDELENDVHENEKL